MKIIPRGLPSVVVDGNLIRQLKENSLFFEGYQAPPPPHKFQREERVGKGNRTSYANAYVTRIDLKAKVSAR